MFRWPWRRTAAPAAPDPPAPIPSGPPDTGRRFPGWRSLPPVQRAVAAMPLTAPVDRLTAALSSWADPRSHTPLGHVVDPDGPSGRVHGLIEPVTSRLPSGAHSTPLDLVLSPAASHRPPSLGISRLVDPAAAVLRPVAPAAPLLSEAAAPPSPPDPPSDWRVPVVDAGPAPAPLTTARPVSHDLPHRPAVPGVAVQRLVEPSDTAAGGPDPGTPTGSAEPAAPSVDEVGDEAAASEADDAAGPAGTAAGSQPVSPLIGGDPLPAARAADGGAASAAAEESVGTSAPDLPMAASPDPGSPRTAASAGHPSAGSGPDVQRQVVSVDPRPVVPADGTPVPASPVVGPVRPRRSRIGEPLTGPVDVQRVGSSLPVSGRGGWPPRGQSDNGPGTTTQPAGPRADVPLQPAVLPAARPAAPTSTVGAAGDGRPPAPAVDLPTVPTTEDGGMPTAAQRSTDLTDSDGLAAVAPDADRPADPEPGGPAGQAAAAPLTAQRSLLPAAEHLPGVWRSPELPAAEHLPGVWRSPELPAAEHRPGVWRSPELPAEEHLPGAHAGPPDSGREGPPSVQRSVPGRPMAASPVPDPPPGSGPSALAPTTTWMSGNATSTSPATTSPATTPLVPQISSGAAAAAGPTEAEVLPARARPLPTASGHRETSGPDPTPPAGPPEAPIAQRTADTGTPAEPAAAAAGAPGPAAASDRPAYVLAPLLGERPGLPSGQPAQTWSDTTALQRSSGGTPPGDLLPGGTASRTTPGQPGTVTGTAVGAAVGVDPQVRLVPVGTGWRGAAASVPRPAGTIQRTSGPPGTVRTHGAGLPDHGAGPRGAWTGSVARSPLTTAPGAEPTAVRWAASDAPFLQRATDPGSTAVALGLARRDADGSVVFAPPSVQREEDSAGEPMDLGPPPDQALGSGGPESPDTAVPAATAPIATAPAAAAPAAATAGTPDLDDLARRLFDPLTARLRAELRLDRERAGLATDLRH